MFTALQTLYKQLLCVPECAYDIVLYVLNVCMYMYVLTVCVYYVDIRTYVLYVRMYVRTCAYKLMVLAVELTFQFHIHYAITILVAMFSLQTDMQWRLPQ